MTKTIDTKAYCAITLHPIARYSLAAKQQQDNAEAAKATHFFNWPRQAALPGYVIAQLSEFAITQVGYTTHQSSTYALTPKSA